MIINKNEKLLKQIENKFKEISNLNLDISYFPLENNSGSQVETDKNKSKQFSEVFTPLWLVDEMIQQVGFNNCNQKTLDLCAGFGQFSIRLMRYYFNTFEGFSLSKFIRNNHYFAELQLSSCYKLISIFDVNLNLFIGDALQLGKLPENANGIWIYISSYKNWVCLTKSIINILCPNGTKKNRISEEEFVQKIECLIQSLNERYNSMEITLKQMTRDKKSRLVLFSALNDATKNTSMQIVDTPEVIVRELVDRVDDLEYKSIMVMFNCEIIEYLIHGKKIDPKNITYVADFGSSLEAKYVKAVYGVDYVLSDDKMSNLKDHLKGKKFDVVFSNPPYNDNVHLKILSNLISSMENQSIAKEFVIVHPANWLIDLKGKENLFINFKSLISNKLKSVKMFNGNLVFDIGLFYPCVITHIKNNVSGEIEVEYFGDKYTVNNINDITKYGKDWDSIVSKFYYKIKSYVKEHGSVWDHNKKKLTAGKEYCQLAAIRGNHCKDKSIMIQDDFYTLVIRNSDADKGIRKSMDKRPGPTFEFNSIIERDNFISYLKTDFSRFCLCFLKISQNIYYGEMGMIPWLDFSTEWTDEKLYNFFDIDIKTQNYIREFLPDYYGLR
jgi:hypothetical protein